MAEPQTISAEEFMRGAPVSAEPAAPTAPDAPQTRTGANPFRDEDWPEYRRLVQTRGTTPAQLTTWLEERGYGRSTNAAEVLTFHRRNPRIAPVNRYVMNPADPASQQPAPDGMPQPGTSTDWIPDFLQDDVERLGLSLGIIDPKTYYGLGNYGPNARRPNVPTTIGNPPLPSWGERFRRSVGETFSEEGHGINAYILRAGDDMRADEAIRRYGSDHNWTGDQIDAAIRREREDRGRAIEEVREQRRIRDNDEVRREEGLGVDPETGEARSGWGGYLRRGSADLGGAIVGDVNPTYFVAPAVRGVAPLVERAAPVVARVLPRAAAPVAERVVTAAAPTVARATGQAGVQGGINVGTQSDEVSRGLRESVDPAEVALHAFLGFTLQGGAEALGATAPRVARWLTGKEKPGSVGNREGLDSLESDLALLADRGVVPDNFGSVDEIRAAARNIRETPAAEPEGGAVAPEQPRPAPVAEEVAPAPAEAVAPEPVDTTPNIERVNSIEALDNELNSGTPPDGNPAPADDLPARQRRAALAERLGYTADEFEALPAAGTLDSTTLERGVQLVDQSNGRINGLLDKAERGELGEADLADLVGEISRFRAVNERLTTGVSEGARILDVAAARDRGPKTLARLLEGTAIRTPDDARILAERLRAANNSPEVRRKILNAVTDPRAEDYALSLWYNALLSHPATHVTNFAGNASHMGLEGFNKGVAALIGQVGRRADRVYGREIAANMYGVVRSFLDLQTYRNIARAFVYRGEDGGKGARAILPGPLTALETPSRALNAADEFWGSMSRMSSLYGQAARMAAKEGRGYGAAYYERVGQLMDNVRADRSTLSKADARIRDDMLENAQNTSDFLTFRDEASPIGRGIESMRSRRQRDTVGSRVVKSGSRLFVPFVQTPDRLTAATLRNSPLAALSPSNMKAILRGGAEGNRVLARFTTGTALTSYLVYLAANGQISGAPNSNYDKAQEQAAGGFQPFSVRVGDRWVSVRGLDPFASNARVVADLVSKYQSGEITDEGYTNGIRQVIGTIGNGLSENTYTENISNFLQMLEPGYRGDMAVNSLLPNVAQTLTTPALVRGINNELDPAVRDTTGDGSLGDRVVGRVMSGWPGLSDDLPQRHDVYGRPMVRPDTVGGMLTRMNVSNPEEDPTAIELQRLSGLLGGRTLITPVSRNDLRNFPANAEQMQQYQQRSGQYILESVRAMQMDGSWDKMSDQERIKEVQGITRDMREAAREELFPQFYGENADPTAAVTPDQDTISAVQFSGGQEEGAEAPAPSTFENSVATSILEDLGLNITDNGIRSREDQERYYNTSSGVAAPGTSPHEFANAIDVEIPDDVSEDEIIQSLEEQGYYGVTVITRRHGTGPHWHIQWEGVRE